MMKRIRAVRRAQLAGLLPVGIAVFTSVSALAATGGLDTTFGIGGYVELNPPLADWVLAHSVIEQEDGKIVVAGTYQSDRGGETGLIIARVDSDGQLDTTFGNGGFATGTSTEERGSAVLQQADGKLVVAGTSGGKAAMWRFTRDGIADAGFGAGGTVNLDTDIAAWSAGIVEQAGGRLVTAVTTGDHIVQRLRLIRFDEDGSVDAGFGSGGTLDLGIGVVLALQEQADGKLLLLHSWGPSVAVTRLYPDGALDEAFGDSGTTTARVGGLGESAWDGSLTVSNDGRIVAATHFGTDFWFYSDSEGHVLRLLPDGVLDPSFGQDGQAVTAREHGYSFHGVALARDGDIIVGGTQVAYPPPPDQTIAWDFALTRFGPDGVLKTDFGLAGLLVADFSAMDARRYGFADAMTMQSDGRIILAGNTFGGSGGYRMGLARFDVDSAGSAGRIRALWETLSADEAAGFLELQIVRVEGSSGDALVRYETIDGDAVAGADYVAAFGELSWSDGDAAPKSIRIDILDDVDDEGEESFGVRIHVLSGGADVAVSKTRVNIVDDDVETHPLSPTMPGGTSGGGAPGGGSIGVVFLLLLLLVLVCRVATAQKPCVHRT